ncbi:hypothetical protein ANN_21611 [Periplaneta americana]|uniref:REM-1 domain-containing protein n=1 Tax=Periplaneta americana TaxID=6978 RepID=A0ABQ8S706_PERAM|nr:hypothetical protein ANN_21611 [Periplaneta americana]
MEGLCEGGNEPPGSLSHFIEIEQGAGSGVEMALHDDSSILTQNSLPPPQDSLRNASCDRAIVPHSQVLTANPLFDKLHCLATSYCGHDNSVLGSAPHVLIPTVGVSPPQTRAGCAVDKCGVCIMDCGPQRSRGEFIRHPVLYELSHKYGLQAEADVDKLDELKEHIRREIRKELKIKEGAEKLREVAKDRRSLADVATIVKKANTKLAELQAELQELESQIILQSAPGTPPLALNNGQGEAVDATPTSSFFVTNLAETHQDLNPGFHCGKPTPWRYREQSARES